MVLSAFRSYRCWYLLKIQVIAVVCFTVGTSFSATSLSYSIRGYFLHSRFSSLRFKFVKLIRQYPLGDVCDAALTSLF